MSSPLNPVPSIEEAIVFHLDRHSSHWRPSTLRFHTGRLVHLRRFLTAEKISSLGEISPAVWSRYMALRRPLVSETCLHHEGQVVRYFLKECLSQGWIEKSPLDGIKLIALPMVNVPTPSAAELDEFLTALKRHHDPKYSLRAKHETVKERRFYTTRNVCLFMALIATGARIGELLALRLCDVDMENQTLIFPKTKTKKSRVVPFDVADLPVFDPILRKYLDCRPKVESDVFFIDHYGTPLTYNAVMCVWKRVRAKCKAKFSIHSVRHYALSRLYIQSGDLKAAMTLAGHSSTQTAMRYQERDLTQLRAAMKKANLTEGVGKAPRKKVI